ncbi:MAG TPA: Ig-like domain-containing protein [Gemmatimonadales bacterium]|nr:Ig-like domain-containing protein [Gemmatimonadales bacterium]
MTAKRLFGHLVVGLAVGVAACGGDSLTIPSNTGVLEVTTLTTGSEPDADGYTVQVDAEQPQAIGVSATLDVADLSPGTHNVGLSGLADNCSVSGDNPQTVTITVGDKTSAAFNVVCGATTGALQVSAQTTGPSPDADGYSISLDGTDKGPLDANGSVTLSNLAQGSHVVGLSGVSSNCTIGGDNLQAVTVTAGETATVTFAVTCVEPPAAVGVLRITTTTGGADRDPNGYQFSVDGGQAQPIGLNTSSSLTNVAVGSHTVVLSDIAANCTVDSGSQDVTIATGQTSTVNFVVNCSAILPTVGTIRVETNTSGPDQDPDGYTFAIDGGQSQTIGANSSKNVPNVAVGLHAVALSGIASNCTVDDDSKDATVVPGATATVTFNVTCTALPSTSGALHITTSTSGSDPDGNGYKFSVDGGPNHNIGTNGEAFVDNVSAGSHRVELSDVASNCTVADQSRAVTVTAGATTEVPFVITCSGVPSASQSTVSADRDNMPVGGSATITVTVRNSNGDPLNSVTVNATSDGSGDSFSPSATATTGSDGMATFTYSSTALGKRKITISAGGITLGDKPEITVRQSATTTTVTGVTPAATNPGESVHVTFTVTTELGGTPTSGTVTVASDIEAAGCIVDFSTNPGANSCDFTLSTPGTHTITASYSGSSQFQDSSDLAGMTHVVNSGT